MKVSQEVMQVLDQATIIGNHLKIEQALDRNLYTKTNKILEAAGGVWQRKAKAHVFDGDAATRIEQILLTGSIDVPKDDFQFFQSPAAVADEVYRRMNHPVGGLLLEPSAGRAALATAFKGSAVIDCIELMPDNAEYLRGLDWVNSVTEADFLSVTPVAKYHSIAMNPPFARSADIKHVLHALDFLAPGGNLTSVMSQGTTFRQHKIAADFRDLVNARGGVIDALPEQSFRSSGTDVNTIIVTIPAA